MDKNLLSSELGSPEEKSSAAARALEVSLEYSFVTPLTSMVVTRPEGEDGPGGPLIADKLTEGRDERGAVNQGLVVGPGIVVGQKVLGYLCVSRSLVIMICYVREQAVLDLTFYGYILAIMKEQFIMNATVMNCHHASALSL